jgi:hypothetical protein
MMRWLILLVCFIVGYLVVSRFMGLPKGPDPLAGGSQGGSGNGKEPERATMSNWYRILGVRENAKLDEIKLAYKRAIAQHHPDKVAQMGEEIRAVAEAKTKQINAAYEIGARLFRKD